MTQLSARPAARPAADQAPPRSYPVLAWAVLGALWMALCVHTVLGWVTSDRDFGPAELSPGDTMPTSSLVALRVVEVASVLVLLAAIWFLAVRPWRLRREVRIEGLLIVGGIFGFVMDSWLNVYGFLFSFNSHSVNLGAWSAHLPFHTPGVPTEYGEALLWGLPMYVYFCSGEAALGLGVRALLLRRWPRMSPTLVLALMWVFFFVFDFVIENLIIRTSEAYSFVRTEGALTLWDGQQYQFPLYESFLVACVAMAFASVRMSAERDPEGRSFIERGVEHLPTWSHHPARLLAATGYAAAVLMICYHMPFNWLSLGGSSMADLPSYLTPPF
ncbi:MAG TPA: spirocyclase AveC family protein [Nocardioides sp.]|nr:spirocyclase AveC family protein [Nocardioides sp.]